MRANRCIHIVATTPKYEYVRCFSRLKYTSSETRKAATFGRRGARGRPHGEVKQPPRESLRPDARRSACLAHACRPRQRPVLAQIPKRPPEHAAPLQPLPAARAPHQKSNPTHASGAAWIGQRGSPGRAGSGDRRPRTTRRTDVAHTHTLFSRSRVEQRSRGSIAPTDRRSVHRTAPTPSLSRPRLSLVPTAAWPFPSP